MVKSRDTEALREFLKDHTVAGYEVMVPIFGPAVIERQISTGGGFVFYRVIADKPVPFVRLADEQGVSAEPMTLQQWRERFVGTSTKSLPPMAVDLREQLEAGERVSLRDVFFRELMDTGCLDIDQNVTCYSFDSRNVRVRALRKGMAVEVDDDAGVGWAGKVVGLEGKTVLLEQFAPVTFMRTPKSIDFSKIRKGFYSSEAWALGFGIMDGFEEHGIKPPAGVLDEDEREYALREPMPIAEIERFCAQYYPDVKHCVYQAMTMFVIPINSQKADFLPLPEGRDPEEYVVDLET